jgi:hypothetical protein
MCPQILSEKLKGKYNTDDTRHRWENIKFGLRETGWKVVA